MNKSFNFSKKFAPRIIYLFMLGIVLSFLGITIVGGAYSLLKTTALINYAAFGPELFILPFPAYPIVRVIGWIKQDKEEKGETQ